MKLSTLAVCSLILALGACREGDLTNSQSDAQAKVQDLVFSRNEETGICVASRSLGYQHGVAFAVDCTPAVLNAIENAGRGRPAR